MHALRVLRKSAGLVIGLCTLLTLISCGAPRNEKPTQEQARAFLKLRGYNFDQKSFLTAAEASDEATVNLFFAAGMDPNPTDSTTSPLIAAASRGDLEMVKTLVGGGANVNQKDEKGFTAILRAIQNKHDDVADVLVTNAKLDLNVQGTQGPTVLMSYVWRERVDIVKDLLERGADSKLSDGDGDTALHGAAQNGNVSLINLLLDAGADPNAKNKLGGTALMWAGVYGHEDAARLLMEKGAKATLRDNDGMTAADWAVKNQREAVARLLREAEKKR